MEFNDADDTQLDANTDLLPVRTSGAIVHAVDGLWMHSKANDDPFDATRGDGLCRQTTDRPHSGFHQLHLLWYSEF